LKSKTMDWLVDSNGIKLKVHIELHNSILNYL